MKGRLAWALILAVAAAGSFTAVCPAAAGPRERLVIAQAGPPPGPPPDQRPDGRRPPPRPPERPPGDRRPPPPPERQDGQLTASGMLDRVRELNAPARTRPNGSFSGQASPLPETGDWTAPAATGRETPPSPAPSANDAGGRAGARPSVPMPAPSARGLLEELTDMVTSPAAQLAAAGTGMLGLFFLLLRSRSSGSSGPSASRQPRRDGSGRNIRETLRKGVDDQIKAELRRQARERAEKADRRRLGESWMRLDRERLARMAREEAERQRRMAEEERRRAEEMKRRAGVKDSRWACSILGVAEGASPEEIRRAYIKGMKDNHPDKAGDVDDTVRAILSERAKLLNIAYGMLRPARK